MTNLTPTNVKVDAETDIKEHFQLLNTTSLLMMKKSCSGWLYEIVVNELCSRGRGRDGEWVDFREWFG